MIDHITVGRGDSRQVIPMLRDRDQRRRCAGAIKGWMFATAAAHRKAMTEGKARVAPDGVFSPVEGTH